MRSGLHHSSSLEPSARLGSRLGGRETGVSSRWFAKGKKACSDAHLHNDVIYLVRICCDAFLCPHFGMLPDNFVDCFSVSGRHIIRSWMMDGTRNIAAAPVQAPQRSPSDPSVEFRPTTPPQPNNLSHGSHFGLPVHTVTSSQFAQHMHHGHHAHHAPNAVHQRTSGDRGRSKSTESNRQGPWVLSQNSGGNSAARVHVSSLHFGTTHGSRAATPVAERGGSSEGFRSLTGTSHGSRAATPVADRSLSSEGLMSLAVNVSNSSRPRSPQPHTGGAPHGSPGHVNSPGPRSPPRSPHAQQRGKVQEMSAREFAIINAGTGALPPLPGPAGRQKVRHG